VSVWCTSLRRDGEHENPSEGAALERHPVRSGHEIPMVTAVSSSLMSAAVYVGDGKLAVERVPRPEPGVGEVLVEVAECGICGSDLHMVLERYAKPGAILGHEWSGIVADAPSDSPWSTGDRVVGNSSPGCGVCRPCRRGRPSVCLSRSTPDFAGYRGAFCQYKTVAADSLIRIPDSLPTRVAALAEPMAITLHALQLADVHADDRVLITGAGPVGLLLVAALRARGVSDVTVSEPSAVRREQALAVGASQVVTPDSLEPPPLALPVSAPYAVVFECSGRASALEAGLGQLDYAGTLVVVGTGFEPPRINQNRMIIFELEVIGAYNYNDEGFGPAVELLDTGQLPFASLIEPDNIPLTDVMVSMERLARGEIPSKVMVEPGLTS
jgi:(R,R)-butanediol dehydrogenase / meso-butanediol dehydrogenase / diacetyl reductase